MVLCSLRFAAGGNELAAWVQDDTVSVWNLATGALIRRLTVPGSRLGSSAALSPHGDVLAVGFPKGGSTLWDLRTGRAKDELPGPRIGASEHILA